MQSGGGQIYAEMRGLGEEIQIIELIEHVVNLVDSMAWRIQRSLTRVARLDLEVSGNHTAGYLNRVTPARKVLPCSS
jgi:hypothetical protein